MHREGKTHEVCLPLLSGTGSKQNILFQASKPWSLKAWTLGCIVSHLTSSLFKSRPLISLILWNNSALSGVTLLSFPAGADAASHNCSCHLSSTQLNKILSVPPQHPSSAFDPDSPLADFLACSLLINSACILQTFFSTCTY